MNDYQSFIERRTQCGTDAGFECELPAFLYDFQRDLVSWSLRKGRAAIFADCGLGKTPMQLVWADAVMRRENKPVLILTPLAVASQTAREAEKFGITAKQSLDGNHGSEIVIANYDRLHHFNWQDFSGVVCDESSILKSFSGATRKAVTRFMAKMKYRLLCTATAAPNDYMELGTSSEAIGELSYSDMQKRFFTQLDDKGQKKEAKLQDEAEAMIAINPNYFKKLAFRVSQTIGQYRLKHHAIIHFWRWVSSWAKACRMPSDIGYEDRNFKLPELIERDHVIKPNRPPPGFLIDVPVIGLAGEREERKRTLKERCEFVAELVNHDRPAVVWCHGNSEGDKLVDLIPDAEQVAGITPDERKIELYEAFVSGELRVLVIKPKIGAWGLNWQHCNHVVTFASHSYEQYYQSVRRCWRFGQKRPVTLDVVATTGEVRVLENMRKKAAKADAMFSILVDEMNRSAGVVRENKYTNAVEVPRWLLQSK